MTSTFDTALASLVGALDLQAGMEGVVPSRLPAWTRPQIVDPAIPIVTTMPAGIRMEFVTDAAWLEIDVQLTLLQLGELPMTPAVFDVVVDGALHTSVSSTEGTCILIDAKTGSIDLRPGGATTVHLDLPGVADSHVEVWLPHAAVVELRDARVPDGASIAPAAQDRPVWVHHGSSISHCLEAPRPTETWPAITARLAGVSLRHLGFGGQCQLDQFVARTIRDLAVDAISLKVGINVVNGDTMRERTFVPALHGFIDTVRDGHPTTPFIVATPIFCPSAETHPGPTTLGPDNKFFAVERTPALAVGALSLQRIRQLVAAVVEARQDPNLHLVSGLDLFGTDEGADLPDDLHPNAAGYRRMGERFHTLAFAAGRPFAALAR